MTLAPDDISVLAYLQSHGPGHVTVRGIAAATELPRVTVQACMHALVVEDLICIGQETNRYGSDNLRLMHVHPAGEDDGGPVAF